MRIYKGIAVSYSVRCSESNRRLMGKGYNRLIAWEGEKTLTFTVTDALMSPLGLKILTSAGLSDASATDVKHVHTTVDVVVGTDGKAKVSLATLKDELGLPTSTTTITICEDAATKPYATVLDRNGAIVDWVSAVTVDTATATASDDLVFSVDTGLAGKTIKLDFYVIMKTGVTEITIAPEDFGGYFYVEADTLYRNQDGKDMAATLTFPKVKIQSGFTLTMAANGDPSTFDFVMDAFPAYTFFDRAKKVVCDITIVDGSDAAAAEATHTTDHSKN